MISGCAAADYEFPASKPVSDECKDFLSRILVVDPARRMTLSEIQVRTLWVGHLPVYPRSVCLLDQKALHHSLAVPQPCL